MSDERRCLKCGCRLSRYNPDERKLCGVCARSTPIPTAQPAPPTVPPHIWTDPGVQKALRELDFGQVSRLLRQHARLRQDDLARLTGLSQGYLSQLESGARRLTHIDKTQAFLDALDVPAELRPLGTGGTPEPNREEADPLRSLATGAAQSSSAFAEFISSSNVSTDELEQFGFTLARIATDYVHAPLLPLFTELVALRDELFDRLQGRQRPQQSRELFMLAGTACLLLAHASQNLGEQASAMAQIRTARLCAEQADHTGLRSWTAGTAALIAEWSPQNRMALKLTEHAARLAPAGEARVRIAAIEARTAARIGDRELSLAAIDRMRQAKEETPAHDEVEQFGGLLTFPPAKQDYYLGSTYTLLGKYEEAHRHATAAIAAYRCGPTEERSYGDEALAHIDLITAGILQGDPDGATTALQHVLDLPPQMRIRQLGSAMDRLGSLMRRTGLKGNRSIGQLTDLIHDYQVIDSTAALRSKQ
ncbi:helix-turn-helix domain-containing protein [Streptomyces sp. NPDC057579]|uniref:helix-turn-helix domain-containing protein n=1 Tax=Streptomyces sp. NPDC057579 TaxID=3346172 RepID=UPI00368B6926